MDEHRKTVILAFKKVVNMPPNKLQAWLETKESLAVGFKTTDDTESIGHQPGLHILELLKKAGKDYSERDLKFANKVVGYAHRHLAQKPSGDISKTHWRYSLTNLGARPASKKLNF